MVSVPEELSILGFGDVEMPGMEEIATIATSKRKLAEAVMEMAANVLAGKTGFETQINIMPEVVDRRSLRPLPVGNAV